MFVKIFQVSADEGMGKRSKLVEFSTQKRFQIRACLISGKSKESVSLLPTSGPLRPPLHVFLVDRY